MKKVLILALILSLAGNGYLGFLLHVESNKIDAGMHAEVMSEMGLRDLSYFLRKCGATRTQLIEWARSQPAQPGTERLGPELVENRFIWFPLEVTFGASGGMEQISIAGDAY